MSQIKGVYNATPPTVRDGQNEDIQLNANGDTKVELNTGGVALSSAANTDRTTATPVIPVQLVGADGGVNETKELGLLDPYDKVTTVPSEYSYKYQAAPAANVVVHNGPAWLIAIIIGANVVDGIIEVSDHASDGDGNVQLYLEGGDGSTGIEKTLQEEFGGCVDTKAAFFQTGITADIANQTHVTFVYLIKP